MSLTLYSASVVFASIEFINSLPDSSHTQLIMHHYSVCGGLKYKTLEEFMVFCETEAKNESWFLESYASINAMEARMNENGEMSKQKGLKKTWLCGNLQSVENL